MAMKPAMGFHAYEASNARSMVPADRLVATRLAEL